MRLIISSEHYIGIILHTEGDLDEISMYVSRIIVDLKQITAIYCNLMSDSQNRNQ